jgi:MFS family permease
VAKAYWEVAALELGMMLLLSSPKSEQRKVERMSFLMGAAIGASLATKVFSILLVPFFACLVIASNYIHHKKIRWQTLAIFLVGLIMIGSPFYIRTWWLTGSPFFSADINWQRLIELEGYSSLGHYLIGRTVTLAWSVIQLTLLSRDYTTWLFLLVPFLWLTLFFTKSKKSVASIPLTIWALVIFSVGQWLLWWYLPPLSTRYALSGFIVLALISVMTLREYSKRSKTALRTSVALLFLAVVINMVPRFFVTVRSLKYITGQQSRAEYIQQFYDGSIDRHLQKWHQLPDAIK